MKHLRKPKLLALLLAALFVLTEMLPEMPALSQSAPPQYGAGSACPLVIPFHISGQYTATTASVVKFNMPYKATLDQVQTTARASGGTSPTLTVDLKKGGTSVLSSAISVTAGTVSTGTVSTAAFSADDVVTADLTIGGTSPTWNDISLVLVFCRQ